MDIDWLHEFEDVEDLLFPQLELDPWERTLYLYLLRNTRMKGQRSAIFAIGPLSKALPISDFKVREVLRALHNKACLKIEDRSRSGHLVQVLLPSEIPALERPTTRADNFDIDSLDFFSARQYLNELLERENAACFYCLKALTAETCELDHLAPQVEKLDNSYRNIVCSCHNCNKAKGSQSAAGFLRNRYRSNLLSEEELNNRLSTLEAIQSGNLVPTIRLEAG